MRVSDPRALGSPSSWHGTDWDHVLHILQGARRGRRSGHLLGLLPFPDGGGLLEKVWHEAELGAVAPIVVPTMTSLHRTLQAS